MKLLKSNPIATAHGTMSREQELPLNDSTVQRNTGKEVVDQAENQSLATWLTAWRAYVAANRKILRQFGVTAQQYAALVEINCSNTPHGLSIGELAAALQIGHNTAVQLVNILCKKGYANRSRHDFDRRIAHLKLTSSGRAALSTLIRIHHREFRNIRLELVGKHEEQ